MLVIMFMPRNTYQSDTERRGMNRIDHEYAHNLGCRILTGAGAAVAYALYTAADLVLNLSGQGDLHYSAMDIASKLIR